MATTSQQGIETARVERIERFDATLTKLVAWTGGTITVLVGLVVLIG